MNYGNFCGSGGRRSMGIKLKSKKEKVKKKKEKVKKGKSLCGEPAKAYCFLQANIRFQW